MGGLLWFDNDPRHTLEDRVTAAAERYAAKVGQPATVAYVNAAALPDGPRQVGAVCVVAAAYVLPHHYLLSRAG